MKKNKIEEAAEEKRQELEMVVHEKRIAGQLTKESIRAVEMFGAIRAVGHIARSLDAQFMRALQQFQDEKGYEAYSFSRFDDFLNGYENSPMTKHQFYERIGVLTNEGDEAFNLLNSLKVPISARKLLGDGSIKIDGEEIVIGEERVSINDNHRIKELIKELAKESAEQSKKLEKGQKDNERLKKKLIEAEKGNGKKHHSSLSDSIDGKVLLLIGAFNELYTELGYMDIAERRQIQPTIIDRIGEQQTRLFDIFQSDKVFTQDEITISDELLDSLDEM